MNTRNPLLIAIVAVAVLGFGFHHFALQPKHKEAADAQTQIDAAQARLDAAKAALATNLTARKTYKASYSKVVRLGKAVPLDDDVRSLMVQLDRVAHNTRVNFVSIVAGDASGAAAAAAATSSAPTGAGASLPPGVTVGAAGFPTMPLTFTFEGSFFRMSAFFQRVNDFVRTGPTDIGVRGRLLTVDSIKLTPSENGFPNLQATVAATSYLTSPLEGATGGATAAGPDGSATGTPATTTAAMTAGGLR